MSAGEDMRNQRGMSRTDRLASLERWVAALDARVTRAQWILVAFGAVYLVGKLCRWW